MFYQFAPQGKREVVVAGRQTYQKMIIECLDGSHCFIHAMIVWLHELDPNILLFKVSVDCLGRHIVQDVEAWFKPPLRQILYLGLEYSHHRFVFRILDELDQNCICRQSYMTKTVVIPLMERRGGSPIKLT